MNSIYSNIDSQKIEVDDILRNINENIKAIEKRRISVYRTRTQQTARKELINTLSDVRKSLKTIIVPESQIEEMMRIVIDINGAIKKYLQNKKEGINKGKNWRNSEDFEAILDLIMYYNNLLAKVIIHFHKSVNIMIGNASYEVMLKQLEEIQNVEKKEQLQYRYKRLNNQEAQPPPSYGGSLFVNVKGVGKRKVRYYKNGNKYVLAKGKKKKI